MQKYRFLGSVLACASLLVPAFAVAQSPLDGINIGPSLEMPKIMSCEVEGSIKQLNTTSNEITYKVKYWSNYSKVNTTYTLYGKVSENGATRTLLTLKGSAPLTGGGVNYFAMNGKQENTFRFAIKNNPGVTVSMMLDGINCTSKYFKTVDAIINVQNQPALGANIQVKDVSVQSDPIVVQQPSSNNAGGGSPSQNQGSAGGTVVSSNSAGIEATNNNRAVSKPSTESGNTASVNGEENSVQGEVVIEEIPQNGMVKEFDDSELKRETIIEEVWSVKDYITVGLLGGILIAMVSYIVLKYRGMV